MERRRMYGEIIINMSPSLRHVFRAFIANTHRQNPLSKRGSINCEIVINMLPILVGYLIP